MNLADPFQTELTIDTNIVVTHTHTVVADTHTVVEGTHTMVADIHRSVLTGQEGTSGWNRWVRATFYRLTTEYLPLYRLKLGQAH